MAINAAVLKTEMIETIGAPCAVINLDVVD